MDGEFSSAATHAATHATPASSAQAAGSRAPVLLSAHGIRKSYGALSALAPLSFTVRSGECLGLLGPNGAGKSTLMGLLSGLLAPDAGTISVCDAADPTRAEVRARVGLMSQALALYPNLSVEENLRFFGRMQALRGERLRERVRFGLQLADLDARAAQRVRTLSGGMQRRLHLGCALLHEPEVLLLDEPTAGVDPHSREHIFRTLERLKAEGLALLYCTHLMEEAARLCERVAILSRGQLVALDTPARLIAQHGGPAHITGELRTPLATPLEGVLGLAIDHWSEQPLAWLSSLASRGAEPRALQVRGACLERVFLNLTGRALRDP